MPSTPDPPPPAAGAPRQPTDDPLRFLLPAEQLPPGFAERVADEALVPVEPRPAATVVLARPAPGGPEVLLLRRPGRSAFAADAWVFPGGVVDAADRDPALLEESLGPAPAEWAARLRLDDPAEAAAFVVAALREAWEETGILLAAGAGAGTGAARRELLGGALSLPELARRERLRLDARTLLYIAHWITPLPETRRYDTRFFLACVPPEAECELHGEELAGFRWLAPHAAVELYRAGELRLLPPTVHTLRRLAGFPTLERLWAAARDAPVPVVTPRMLRDERGVVVEVIDDGYFEP